MEPGCRATRPLEQRGIEQKRAAVGESPEVAVPLLRASAARLLAGARDACRTRVEVQVAPEIFKLLSPPIQPLGEPAIKFHAEMIGKRCVLPVFSKRAPGCAARQRSAKPPRQVALQPRHHGQQGFPADPFDELAMPRRMSDQGAPVILLRVIADEARGQSASAQRGHHALCGFLRGERDVLAGVAGTHGSYLYLPAPHRASCISSVAQPRHGGAVLQEKARLRIPPGFSSFSELLTADSQPQTSFLSAPPAA